MADVLNIALALIEDQGRWLVGRRSDGRVFAGLWEFPGGKMAAGEAAAEAAVREAWEETGLRVEPTDELGVVITHHADREVRLHLVLCRVREGVAKAREAAVAEVCWVEFADLAAREMPPANAEVLRRLAGRCDRRGG